MALTQGSPLPNITTSQTQQTTAPSWYTDYLSGLAKSVTAQTLGAPATTVDGVTTPAVAPSIDYVGTQPLQQSAFSVAGNIARSYGIDPTTGQPVTTATSTGGATSPGGVQPQGVSGALSNLQNLATQDITAASTPGGKSRIEQFMNPYTTQVVDALGALGKRNIEQYLAPQATAGAVGTGQFGSKRGAEVLGQAINTGLQNLGALQSQALQSGYTEALRAAQAEQDKRLAQNMGYVSAAQTGQNMTLADINALATMGGQQQTIAQNKELFPLQTAITGTQALRGYSVPTGATSSYTGPIPGAYSASPLSQIAGLGSIIAGASDTTLGKAIMTKLGKYFNPTDTTGTSLIANPATEGQPGYGWRYYTDGTAIDPYGNYYYQGEQIYTNPENVTGNAPGGGGWGTDLGQTED